MLRPRDEWGEQTNRWYWRGLAPAALETFVVSTRRGLVKRNPGFAPGVRAIRRGVGIYPPEAWRPPRLNKRRGPIDKRTSQPVQIAGTLASMIETVTRVPQARDLQLPLTAGARERASVAVRLDDAGASDRIGRADLNSSSGRRYASSRQKVSAEIDSWLARMLEKHRPRDG
ncbi:MAG: hypothetical protein ACRET2_13025 [Steroidobacteraceae bacterium]